MFKNITGITYTAQFIYKLRQYIYVKKQKQDTKVHNYTKKNADIRQTAGNTHRGKTSNNGNPITIRKVKKELN